MPDNDMAAGTVCGLLLYLRSAAVAAFDPVTVAGWRSTATAVTTTLGLDPDLPITDLDVELVMDRFVGVKGRHFRGGPTHRSRLRAMTRAYLAWLSGEATAGDGGLVSRPPTGAGGGTVTSVVRFAVRADLMVALELPPSLSPQVGRRLHALIDSLVTDSDVEPVAEMTQSSGVNRSRGSGVSG